jgi:hypothetical protein
MRVIVLADVGYNVTKMVPDLEAAMLLLTVPLQRERPGGVVLNLLSKLYLKRHLCPPSFEREPP